MAFFDKIIQKIFPQKQSTKEPFVTEKLLRPEKYKQDYFKWINEGEYKNILNHVYEAYQLKLQKEESEFKFHILATPYANGFALSFHPNIGIRQFSYLFDFLKDQVLNYGYQLKNSSRKVYDKPNYVESIEKYYLKPPLKGMEDGKLFNQMFGNISVEYILIDEKPSYLKLVASVYSDRLYTKALPFEELIEKLFIK